MERRTFLIAGGGFLLASTLAACAGSHPRDRSAARSSRRRYQPSDFPTPILKAISLGMNAPNPHNTQAWKFLIHSDTAMTLYIDESRLLPRTDPPARQIHIGAGCFLELLSLGAPSLGYLPKVEMLPQGEYPLEKTGFIPVASVNLQPCPRREHPLVAGIYSRQTNRQAYQARAIGPEEFQAVLKAAEIEARSVERIEEPQRLSKILDLCFRGMEIETRLYRTNEESRIWFRGSEKAMIEKRDGITLEGNGLKGIRKFFAEHYLQGGNPERWHSANSLDSYLKSYQKTLDATSAVVQFKTRSNTMGDWLAVGGTYVRFQLAADLRGWYLHPMSQILQEFPEMQELSNGLRQLENLDSTEKVQMLVRIGRGKPTFQSFRKNPAEMVIPREPSPI